MLKKAKTVSLHQHVIWRFCVLQVNVKVSNAIWLNQEFNFVNTICKSFEKKKPKRMSIWKTSRSHLLSDTHTQFLGNRIKFVLQQLEHQIEMVEWKSKDFFFSKLILNSTKTSEISQRIWHCSITIDVLAVGGYMYIFKRVVIS